MLKWAALVLLFGVTLGEIQRIENVTDSCEKGNLKMCGKKLIWIFLLVRGSWDLILSIVDRIS